MNRSSSPGRPQVETSARAGTTSSRGSRRRLTVGRWARLGRLRRRDRPACAQSGRVLVARRQAGRPTAVPPATVSACRCRGMRTVAWRREAPRTSSLASNDEVLLRPLGRGVQAQRRVDQNLTGVDDADTGVDRLLSPQALERRELRSWPARSSPRAWSSASRRTSGTRPSRRSQRRTTGEAKHTGTGMC